MKLYAIRPSTTTVVPLHPLDPRTTPDASSPASRRLRAAAVFDEHGAALRTFTSVLTRDSETVDALVVGVITSATLEPGGSSGLRDLAAETFRAWSDGALPLRTIIRAPDDPLPLATLTTLHELPDVQRSALALCAFGDHQHRQAARLLQLPVSTVPELLREALQALCRCGPRTAG